MKKCPDGMYGVVLGACVFVCSLGCMSVSNAGSEPMVKTSMPSDSTLNIPREDGFEHFKDVTLESLKDVKLYNRYPASWRVVNLEDSWKGIELDKQQAADREAIQKLAENEKEIASLTAKTLEEGKPPKLTVGRYLQRWYAKNADFAVTRFTLDEVNPEKHSYLLCFPRKGFWAVYVNGKQAFQRSSGYGAFSGDISSFVKQGENTIAILKGGQALVWGSEVVVATRSYVTRMQLTTDVRRSLLEMIIGLENRGLAGARKLTATINSWGSDDVLYQDTKEFELLAGKNAMNWDVRMPEPEYWTPDNPHLYEIRISDEAGKVLGKERFGFRDFECRNENFYLNGKPIKLFGASNFGKYSNIRDIPMAPGDSWDTFDKRWYYAYLRMFKQGNVNTIHSYRSPGERRACLEACDELGFLAYVILPGFGGNTTRKEHVDLEEALAPMKKACIEHLQYCYNHPSFVMYTFGTEQYTSRPENLAYAYHQVKAVDRQRRPATSSAGRCSGAFMTGKLDTLDFADDHSYYGTLRSAWMRSSPYFQSIREGIDKLYGEKTKPLVSSETLETHLIYGLPTVTFAANKVMTAEPVDRQAYVNMMENDDPNLAYSWIRLVLSRGRGLRKTVTDEVYGHTQNADLFRRIVEMIRQEDVMQGFLPFWLTEFVPYDGTMSLAKIKQTPKYADIKVDRLGFDCSTNAFTRTPAFFAMKRVFNLESISAKWFDRYLISGSGEIKTSFYAINDTAESHNYAAKVLLRSPDGTILCSKELDFGEVAPLDRKILDFQYPIPADLKTGIYSLEMYMFEGERRVNDNHYDVFVFNRSDVAYKAESGKRVAYHGDAATERILKKMDLKFTGIRKFDDLANYQVLILGNDSLDEEVFRGGEKIRQWVENGGRLLSFEQTRAGYIPWMSEVKVIKADPVAAIDIVEKEHPMYKGLDQVHFDTWSGDGLLFTHVLAPLNKSVVAAGASGYVLRPPPYTMPVVCDLAVGKGIMLMSQLRLTDRYDHDAAATIVANNMVRYILSDDKTYSEKIEGDRKRVAYLDKDACTYIDLKPYATASHSDNERGSDASGGWDDYGPDNDNRAMPLGEQRLAGVPYYLITPEENQGKSVIMLDDPRLPWTVKGVKGIKVNDTFHSLYVLHIGLSTHADYAITVNYEDGTSVKQEVKYGIHIGAWSRPVDLPQADVAWVGSCPNHGAIGAWQMEWVNPNPHKKVSTIDIEGDDGCAAVIIAMTAYRVIGEEGWETKSIQERKKKDPEL